MIDNVTGSPRVWTRHRDGSLSIIYQYVCLPDTVDPRGPKAKR